MNLKFELKKPPAISLIKMQNLYIYNYTLNKSIETQSLSVLRKSLRKMHKQWRIKGRGPPLGPIVFNLLQFSGQMPSTISFTPRPLREIKNPPLIKSMYCIRTHLDQNDPQTGIRYKRTTGQQRSQLTCSSFLIPLTNVRQINNNKGR